MADDPAQRGGRDRTRINVGQDCEARYRAELPGISEDELRPAAAKVGPIISDLERPIRTSFARKSACRVAPSRG